MKETIRLSRPGDPEALAPLLRAADEREARAGGYPNGLTSLRIGMKLSAICLTIEEEDGTPCVMVGVVKSPDPLMGYIWLLGSDFITRRASTFLRHSKPFLDGLHCVAPVLGNFVHCENTAHVRWLRWLGFTFINTTKGADGSDFLEFVRVNPCAIPR